MPKKASSYKVGCAIDFETSGYEAYRSCALGMTRIENGVIGESYYTLIRPPAGEVLFSHIHCLTWDDLKDAPTFREVWPNIAEFLKGVDFLVAHNAPFDRKVYYASLEKFELTPIRLPFLCTLKGSRRAFKELRSKTLDVVCRHLNIHLDNHHHAASDALACANIYLRLKALGITDNFMRLNDI